MKRRFVRGAASTLGLATLSVVAALLTSAGPAMAQVTANGTTVDLTPAQAVCNIVPTCFFAENGGTINSNANPVTVTTSGGNAYGAYALSGGTINLLDGGTITTGPGANAPGLYAIGAGSLINSTVTISTSGDASFGAFANSGGTINLTSGSITTSGTNFGTPSAFGLYVGAGSTITSVIDVTTHGIGAHGAAATGGTITLNAGTIATTGSGAFGLVANSGGTINSAATISTANDNSYGALAGVFGGFAGVGTINLTGGPVTTAGASAHGLYASGAASTITSVVDVTTNGGGAYGAYAQGAGAIVNLNGGQIATNGSAAYGLNATGGGAINSSATVSTALDSSYGAYANGGTINLTGGSITTTGINSSALHVTGPTPGTITSNVDITTSNTGSHGAWAETGTITLNGGTINIGGFQAHGIYTNGGTVNSAATLSTTGTGGRGAWADAGGTINLTGGSVTTSGVGGVLAYGLLATGGTITSVADVTTSGANTYAAFAQGSGSTIDLNGGTLATGGAAAHGLYSSGAGAAITAFGVGVAASGAGAAGIFIENTGAMTVSNSTISSALGNALFSTVGAGLTNTTQISRSVLSSGSDTAMVFTGGGTHNISLQLAQVTGGNGTLLSVDAAPNQLVLNADASVLNGNMVNSGTADVTLSAGTIWTGASLGVTNLTVDGSTWNVTGDSTITGTLTNGGSIAFAAAGLFKSITVPNYVGNGGTMGFNTQLGADNSPTDKLIIDGGSATGTTGVTVTNKGGAGALTTGNGIQLIEAQGGATTTGAFALAGPVAAGPFQYLLFQGAPGDPESWFLRSQSIGPPPVPFYRPEGSIYGSLPGLARTLGVTTIGTFHERYGDQNAVRGGEGRAWGRVFGEHSEQGSSGELDTRFDGWLGGVQLGIDAFRIRGNDGA